MNFDRAVIEVNGACNYTCQMCPQSKGRDADFLGSMDKDTFKAVLRQTNPKIVNLEGSGEPTMKSDLPWYIETAKEHGAKVYIFSNGLKMRGQFMKDCVSAGLDFFRFSIIGYNEQTYLKWMNSSSFNWVLENLYAMRDYAKETHVSSYHLLLDEASKDYELKQYLKIADGGQCEIWAMHNWSGMYEPEVAREGQKRTCGRPFANDIVIRANGAVHPCCQVLGRDSEAVLGNVHGETIKEIYHGHKYNALRTGHRNQDYPSFCNDCDFLIQDPEVLIYSNYAQDGQMNGTNFNLKEL